MESVVKTTVIDHDGHTIEVFIYGAPAGARPLALCACGRVFPLDKTADFALCPITKRVNPATLATVAYEAP